ncbi:MAG: M48 family metalloprotease, partial [Burkholderiaceae bacterium]
MKRIFLFLLTNLAVMLVLSIIISVFGIGNVLDEAGVGLDLGALLVLSAVVGMTGSLVSLAMSKFMAKQMTNAQVINQPRSEMEQWLVRTVERQAQQAGIGMPEVAIYESPDLNAFATGMFRNDALVAVSTGLLQG